MATTQNAIDVILQAAPVRIAPSIPPPNLRVPNIQVSGLGALALRGMVTADVMAANSITAGNGAIGDLSVGRLKITDLAYQSETVYLSNGYAEGISYHYSGRNVIVYGGVQLPVGYPIAGHNITYMQTNQFTYTFFCFNNAGTGYTGNVNIFFGFL